MNSISTLKDSLSAKLAIAHANQTIKNSKAIINSNMQTAHLNLPLLNFIQSKAWAISSTGIKQLASHANSSLDLTSEDFYELRPATTIRPDGTAIVHLHGALVDSCPPIYEKLGIVTKYSSIADDIRDATANGAKQILLVVNSPGGTVAGIKELTNIISASPIPIRGYCAGSACSAAYYVIAGTKSITASPSATVGNIGAILTYADESAFWSNIGIEFKALTSEGADLKSTFHLEPNEAQIKFLQNSVNESGAAFKAHVQRHRPGIAAEVFRAGWYSGDRALALGLVDSIGTIESLLSAPASSATNTITAPNSATKATLTKPPQAMQNNTPAAIGNGLFTPTERATMTKSEFDALSPADKMTFSKTRGKIVDLVEAAPHRNNEGLLTRVGLAAMNPTERMAHFKAGGKLAE